MLYDVAVVGSGPAGSTAAAALARGGRSVLLVDREEFPRDKACGDLIGPRAFGVMDRIGVPPERIAAAFYPMAWSRLSAPRGRLIDVTFPRPGGAPRFGMIARRELDEALRQHALASGATYRTMQVRQLRPFDGEASTLVAVADGREEELRARAVVGADGASSLVARALGWGQPTDAHRGVAIRGYATSREPLEPVAELYFLKQVLPGYAWFFPADAHTVNIGVGIRTDFYRREGRSLKGMLAQFLDLPAVRERIVPESLTMTSSWTLNLGSHGGSRVFDGAVLVGDAGSFIDPLVGAGIHTAMITAELAAAVLLDALRAGDLRRGALAPFDRRWRQALARDFAIEHGLQRLVARLPGVVDVAAAVLPPDSAVVRYFLKKL